MILGLSAMSVDLVILGGLLVGLTQALVRRDPVWAAALGLPILLCGDHVGVSPAMIAWGFALYVLVLAVGAITALGRGAGLPGLPSLFAIVAGTVLIVGKADAHHLSFTAPSLHAPPAIGVRLAELARTIDAPGTAP
ncbi:hypothetical protein [Sphingomonas oryzagri]